MAPVSRTILRILLTTALLLPPAQLVLFWVERLLAAMDDAQGAQWVARLILALAVLWLIDLVALVLALAINASDARQKDDDDRLDP
jgi:hypothetical protein